MNKDQVPGTNFIIFQDEDEFKYTTDSLILSSFVKNGKKAIDLGCGNGILSLRLAQRFDEIHSVDINKKVLENFKESLIENKLEEKIKIVEKNIFDLKEIYETNYFEAVVFNPPYYDYENIKFETIPAKHFFDIEKSLYIVNYLLKNSGYLYIIYPTYRLAELIYKTNLTGLRVKHIVNIHGNLNKDPKNSIVIARKQGNFGNDFRDFYIREGDNYTEDMERVYRNEVIF
ncbi:tRNA1(Val) (adenine(37)-N6)-methyltransferase [uncultured Peptoniphilus sp.]|uniref:tRNA1(Val) (adenine(37)-N6)-methyltransferase n=1 Tax=uncultured Peptoniphilus sp. TaxID=254354 RepID=UPI0025DA5AF5|nr:methyltransferase domain-containing protein [uncultured Peptoniphilus sp.]